MTLATPAPAPTAAVARPAPQQRVRFGASSESLLHLVVALVGALAVDWMLYERILPVSGAIGFWLLGYALFLLFYAAASSTALDRVGVVDRVVGVLLTTGGVILVVLLVGIVGFTLKRGWPALHHLNFFTQTTAFIGPNAPLDKGGMLAAMVGTTEQVALSLLMSVPLAIATAVYLNEGRGWLPRAIRIVVDAMSAIPTIVAGLFVYSAVIIQLHGERSGLAASFALCISMVPVVTRTSEVVLRLVPMGLREAALALGCTQWQTVKGVLLPTARPGLVTAVLLGVARVVGETSPVLLVAGSTSEMNANPLRGPQVSLPLFVFNEVRLPLDQAISRAFGAAVVLLLFVVIAFTAARVIGGRSGSRRRRRRPIAPRRMLIESEPS